ncbi:hypothetical protein [Pseudoalteromonas rubra]|nr:hypothetical protein [Pseudoalteromonas rubra]
MKSYLTILALSCTFAAHGQIYYSEQVGANDLGRAFDPTMHKVSHACLQGTPVQHSEQSGSLDYFQRVDETFIKRRTFGEVHGGVNLFIIAGSVSTSMTHRNATDQRTLTSQLHLKFDEGYSTLENRQVKSGVDLKDCGSHFVYQVNYGRDLFVNTRLHFRTEEDYKRFVIKIKIRLLFFKKTITKVKEIEKYAENAVFSVDVNSNGPLPAKLQQQLNEQPTYCRGGNITPCLQTLESLVAYSFDPNGLMLDLADLDKVPRSFVVKSYQDSGHYGGADWQSVMSNTLYEATWRWAEHQYGEAVRHLERTKAFLSVATDAEKPALEAQFEAAQIALNDAGILRQTCLASPWLSQCGP